MERRMVRICRAGDQLPTGSLSALPSIFPVNSMLTLQDVQADAAELVDVWMVDLGEESDLGGSHGVVVGKEELELEGAAWESVTSAICRRCSCGGYTSYSRMVTAMDRRW
jgi:hypothetical protein